MSKSFKNISVVATATMVSRVLGLVRDQLVTAVFGASALASAFYTAFALPNLFRRLLGEGALTAALVPTLQDEFAARQRPGAFALVNQVASWLFVVTGTLVVVAMFVLSQADRLVALMNRWEVDVDTVRRFGEASDLAVLLFPYLVFVCMAAAFSAALQTLNRFLEPALSPIWGNVSIIVFLAGAAYAGWSASPEGQMLWLCWGALAGGFLQMAVPAGALMHEGWRPKFDLTVSPGMRQIVRLMGPMVFSSAIYLINMTVSRLIGLSLNDSAVTILNLATRLMELPIGVFAIAISTVIFPLIAKHAAARDWDNLGTSYRKGMRLILVINVPAAVGLVVLAAPIIRLLFQRGAFDGGDTEDMRPVLAVFAAGLPFLSFVNLALRAFYAEKDTKTPVRAAVLSFIVNLGLSFALMGRLGTTGLALAGSLAVVVQAGYLQWHLSRRHPQLAFHHLVGTLAKVLIASAIMGALELTGWWAWERQLSTSRLGEAGVLLLLIAGAVAIYGSLLWALKIEGREDLAAVFAKVRAKFSR
ncbi:MAG TPA: murein biosynthesis integral membrane protein MurJ [Opitutaceae bacterium]|nr:murein biosynthesis integral membrane protein MurJ [Opitutaceae bacterium]